MPQRSLLDSLAPLLFVLGLVVGAFGVGFLVAKQRLFPYDQLAGAQEALLAPIVPISSHHPSIGPAAPGR